MTNIRGVKRGSLGSGGFPAEPQPGLVEDSVPALPPAGARCDPLAVLAAPGTASPLVVPHLATSMLALQGTERCIAALAEKPEALQLARPTLASGHHVLLLVPTENRFKVDLLAQTVRKAVPKGVRTMVHMRAASSEVNEQPYDSAGVRGAYNRIKSTVAWLSSGAGQRLLHQSDSGTVLVASIENFIALTPPDGAPPADFGVVAMYNVGTGASATAFSRGVTVPGDYLAMARRLGRDDKAPECGTVTVGKVIAANVPGICDDNWHQVVAHISRYALLSEAAETLSVPL